MKKSYIFLYCFYFMVFFSIILFSIWGSRTVTAFSENQPLENRHCFIIDAGHGGVDGGAISCTGVFESHLNLEISLRLNDLLHLLGYDTKMIRSTDISVYTEGETIAAKKASDLKQRVKIVKETENGILLSIHQNHYSDSYYDGAQMFYPNTTGSKELATALQTAFVGTINTGSNRQAKPVEGLYLMRNIDKPGVLIECGFLSNYAEEAKLRTGEYQRKICCVIASVCSEYLLDRAGENCYNTDI